MSVQSGPQVFFVWLDAPQQPERRLDNPANFRPAIDPDTTAFLIEETLGRWKKKRDRRFGRILNF